MGTIDCATLANQYLTGQAVTPSPFEILSFNQWVEQRFTMISHWVSFVDREVSPEEMEADWDLHAKLTISTAHNEHPFWSAETNAKFRAIHDWDHVHGGFSFGLAGEVCAAGYAMSTAPEPIKWILWSEIALQAAAAIHTGEFQEQKLVRV